MPITVGTESYVDPDHEEFLHPEVTIGNYTSVANGVIFCGAMNHVWVGHKEGVSTFNFCERWKGRDVDYFKELGISRGPITIGSDVWIGRDAFIHDGVTIGDGAIIGARAMVAKDVPPYAIVVGNPGMVVKYRFDKDQIEKLLRIKWWNWEQEKLEANIGYLKDINKFIERFI